MAASGAQTVSSAAGANAPASQPAEGEDPRWRSVLGLPCQLTVDVPVPRFRVSDFVALRRGSVIGTHWGVARDVPLRINGTLIGWGELEGAANRLAVRLTELA